MGSRQLTVLGLIAIVGLLGGIAIAALGIWTLVAARGASFGAWLAVGLAVGELVLGAAAIVPAALLLRAISILNGPGSVRSTSRLGAHFIAGAVAVAILAGWSAPAVLLFGAQPTGDFDQALSVVGVGIGVIGAATAYTARAFGLRPLGVAMVLIPLVSLWLPLQVSSTVASQQARQADYAAAKAHFEARFAEILQGPSIEELTAAVGNVGEWRVLGGGVRPMERAERYVAEQEPLTNLGGSSARFALVGQCTADFDGGQLVSSMTVFGLREANGDPLDSWSVEFQAMACDGQLHVSASDKVVLPKWDSFTLAGVARHDWVLVSPGSGITAASRAPTSGSGSAVYFDDSGERWLAFVSVEPAPRTEALVAAVAAHLAPLTAP